MLQIGDRWHMDTLFVITFHCHASDQAIALKSLLLYSIISNQIILKLHSICRFSWGCPCCCARISWVHP